MEPRAVLAVLEYLIGQFGFIFDGAETVLEKESGMRVKRQTD